MALACLLGAHKWMGCICTVCSKHRNLGHNWNGCTCTYCAQVRKEQHDWRRDCECCSRCGSQRPQAHRWEGCQCILCYATRDQDHDWTRSCQFCARCGKAREIDHLWQGCRCQLCAVSRDQDHSWQGCTCSACGKVRDQDHDWQKNCQCCSACGRRRMSGHQWAEDDEPCLLCGAENPERSFHQGNSYYLEVLESQTAEEALDVALQAMAEYEVAAAAGHPLAMNMLALLLVETDGNLERAREWLTLAAETGIRDIHENLRNLRCFMHPSPGCTRARFNYTWGDRPPRIGSLPVACIRPSRYRG